LRRQPERASVFAWLYVVAIHEAYRLSAIERRELHLEDLAIEGDWDTILAGRVTVEDQLEALEALRALARPPRPPTPRPVAARGRLQLSRDRRQ
jgi:DNA-directed RNA polymerase specialized sigma24 family protein